MKNLIIFLLGILLIIFGMALVLKNWETLTMIVTALIGPFIAIAGLVLMLIATIKQGNGRVKGD